MQSGGANVALSAGSFRTRRIGLLGSSPRASSEFSHLLIPLWKRRRLTP